MSCKEEPIQGLVHISSLGNEYFFHDEIKNILIGEKSRKVYRVGDKIAKKIINNKQNCFKFSFINISKKTYIMNKDVIAKPVPLDDPINTAGIIASSMLT